MQMLVLIKDGVHFAFPLDGNTILVEKSLVPKDSWSG